MRLLVALLCILSLFACSSVARAYYDDSVVIEIGDVLPPEPNEEDAPPSTQGGGEQPSASSGGGSSSNPGNSGGNQTSNTSSSGTPASSSSSSSSSGGAGGSQEPDQGAVFEELSASGAITESGGSSAGGSSASASGGAGAQQSSGGASAGAGWESTIVIKAAKVRSTLLGKTHLKDILDDYTSSLRDSAYGKRISDRDIGLMAASTVLGDSNIEEVTFGATRFEILYRAQGYLFGILPKSFRVKIGVNPQASAPQEPVTVSLPWYRFLLRRFFDSKSLAKEIQGIVQIDGEAREGETASDVKARLFNEISELLRKKVGTITVTEAP